MHEGTARQTHLKTADGADQLTTLAARGVFDAASIAKAPDGLARPSDEAASLVSLIETRRRTFETLELEERIAALEQNREAPR